MLILSLLNVSLSIVWNLFHLFFCLPMDSIISIPWQIVDSFSLLSWIGNPSPNPVLGSGFCSDFLPRLKYHFYSQLIHRNWISNYSCLFLDLDRVQLPFCIFFLYCMGTFTSCFLNSFYLFCCLLSYFSLSLLCILRVFRSVNLLLYIPWAPGL